MPTMHMTKVPEYPRPHDWTINFAIPTETAAVRNATIIPLITYDEGLGAMSAYESNPTNAAFVEANTDHCFPTSRVNKIFAKLDVSMSKIMLETDKVHAIRFCTGTIHAAFNETGAAADEVSTLDLNEILELDLETTDRQMYPLWNDIDLHDYKSNAGLDMPAETPGLDTDLEIEAVAWSWGNYYDALHYHTTSDKLRNVFTGIQWHTLTRQHPVKSIFFRQFPNTKALNPYTFLGAFVGVPPTGTQWQFGKDADTTVETCTLEFTFSARYNEWNHEFNHSML